MRRAAAAVPKPGGPSDYTLMGRALQYARAVASQTCPITLTITEAEAGAATPWLIVGRFDFDEPVGYAELGEVLVSWRDDSVLERMIDADRLSQIRVVYNDPDDPRGSGDSIVSTMGAWSYMLSDLIRDLLGSGEDDPDSLAVKYEATTVSVFYVYLSAELVRYVTHTKSPSGPGQGPGSVGPKTQTMRMR